MSYPKWKFRGDEKQLVQTPDEEKALGHGWNDAPGDAPKPAPPAPPEKPADDDKDDDKDPKAYGKKK